MSDYLAVAGVSAVLRSLLTSALPVNGPSAVLGASAGGITALSPDLIPTGTQKEQPQLNLFMYYISLNPALRNFDLPSTNKQGDKLSNPPLALNLHYLVSAYGTEQFDPEVLLAWAMKIFHDTPVVPRQTIQQALDDLQTQTGAAAQLIAGSTLATQIEHIRITPETLTTEEIYRLWPAFQAAYRPSTAIQISVVVIQDTQAFTSNLPVQTRAVTAVPLLSPVIDSTSPARIAAGQVLTITGSNFIGDSPADTAVSFDGDAGVAPNTVQSNLVRITLPATLAAGTRMVRVQRTITFSSSTTPHRGFSSSPAPFQLIPTIQDASPVHATLGSPLTLTLSPDVGRTQQATLYIGDNAIPVDERPTSAPPSSPTIAFPIPTTLSTGLFPLRVEIDGAQSTLNVDASGQFSPQVQVNP